MTSEIIVAIVSLLGTSLGSFGGLRLTTYRIQQLEKKVDKHNNFAEQIPVMKRDIQVANHRIKDIERIIRDEKN